VLRRLAPQLMIALTVIVIIVRTVSGYFYFRTQESRLRHTVILGADQLSRAITGSTWQAMLADHRETAYEVMRTIALKQGIERIRMFNREGLTMFSTRPEDVNVQVSKHSETCIQCHQGTTPLIALDPEHRSRITRLASGERGLHFVTPIYNEPACSNAACHAHPANIKVLGFLDLSLRLDDVDQQVRVMQWHVIVATIVEVLIICGFSYFFVRRFVSRPIEGLVDGTHAVSQMELDKPIQVQRTSSELDELAHSFNVMQVRLKNAVGELNQFNQKLESKVQERTHQLRVAEKKLIQSDRLASLGQLSASVAHEINNPLSSVLNLSMLMQRVLKSDGIPPERLEDFRRYLSQVTQETTRVGRIVADLLSFSRRSKPHRAPADMNKIVSTTLSLISHKMKLSNVDLETSLEEDLPMVCCDASQMQQVMLNLLLNAAEATQAKGRGRVLVATLYNEEADTVVVTVSDNGEGIQPEILKKIFDPFFTTKPEGKGVGLGLAVVYGIVQSHGGDIDVQSVPGEGTKFTVVVPVNPPEAEAAAAGSIAGVAVEKS
jgi:two-component system, NtrC family, sensor kinase